MMRSMFSAISGLRSHQTRMDVIGNNIANVNTYGFAASRLTFAESLAQTLTPAAAPANARGGTNALQIGLGTKVSTIDMLMGVGAPQRTDRLLDLMINGDGFFVLHNPIVPPPENTPVTAGYDLSTQYFTRAGNFYLDAGVSSAYTAWLDRDPELQYINLTSGTGLHVMGWSLNFEDTDPAYVLPDGATASEGPLAARLLAFADAVQQYKLDKEANPDDDTLVEPNFDDYYIPVGVIRETTGTGTADDPYVSTDQNNPNTFVAGTMVPLRIPSNVRNLAIDGSGYLSGQFIVPYVTQNAAGEPVLDAQGEPIVQEITVYVPKFARIATATFLNPEGLERIGDNYYVTSENSGEAVAGAPGEGRNAELIPGSVEMSNVDLASEFTNMITTQRGFQANSRVITVSDTLLEELVNLKR